MNDTIFKPVTWLRSCLRPLSSPTCSQSDDSKMQIWPRCSQDWKPLLAPHCSRVNIQIPDDDEQPLEIWPVPSFQPHFSPPYSSPHTTTRLLETSHTMSPPLWGLHICYALHPEQPSSNSSSSPSKPISATTSSKKPSILPPCHPACGQPLLYHWKKSPNYLSHSTCYTALSATNYTSLLPGFQPTASSQRQSRTMSHPAPNTRSCA